MKKFAVTIFIVLLIVMLHLPELAWTQEFETGTVGVKLSQYGRVRIYSGSLTGLIQIDRTSILVGADVRAVFDYYNDADAVDPPINVASPQLSDFELYGSIDNSWSGAAPDVLVRNHVYGWTGGAYCVVKQTVINLNVEPIDAMIGLEIIAEIDGIYGNEEVQWLNRNGVISVFRDTSHVGYKWLADPLVSLKVIDWYDGYNSLDDSLWNWLNYGQFDLTFQSGLDGAVTFPAQASVTVAAGDSTTIYFAMAYGASESEMMDNIALAEAAYGTYLGVPLQKDTPQPLSYGLKQNYPNPFNPETLISFQLPSSGPVSLRVHDLMGKEVATLIDRDLTAGSYDVEFNAGHLPSGVYLYTLRSGQYEQTHKMLLLK
jgi:hypothetical protein